MEKKNKPQKLNYLWLILDIIFMIYSILFVGEMKWKLLLLTYGVLMLIRTVHNLLDDVGLKKGAVFAKKLDNVYFAVFFVAWIVILLGCIFGSWNL